MKKRSLAGGIVSDGDTTLRIRFSKAMITFIERYGTKRISTKNTKSSKKEQI